MKSEDIHVETNIDYVMIRNSHRKFVTDSRSYSGINTNTDHRLVKTSFTFDYHKLTNSKK